MGEDVYDVFYQLLRACIAMDGKRAQGPPLLTRIDLNPMINLNPSMDK